MEAATWTALGILAAFSFGVLALQVSQNSRVDAVRDRLESRFERLDARVDQGFRELRNELRDQGQRFERSLEEHEAHHRG
jgi:hypothetical protein